LGIQEVCFPNHFSKGWVPVKKVIAFLLLVAMICTLSVATTGCGGGDTKKKTEEKKDGEKK
jgi:hypothetical protein